jgi:cell fate regulator YaaT (PSP1 superfamily)
MVVVETSSGYDIGRISLSGDLVRLQMKKRYTQEHKITLKVLRKANERDLEKLSEARKLEQPTLVKSRVIARTMGLDMKLGDIEYQGDKRKATFYYTAEGRVDFRELVKEYAREFKVKIEMRQIGARQESGRIGGIGSCGRELCCSTWLSDFKSVNTGAARYQNVAINQSKLSGQCGRLKCCLNYELDTYMDALEDFPDNVDTLKTLEGKATLVKTDIFKGLFYYVVDNEKMRGQFIAVDKSRVKEIKEMNLKGQTTESILTEQVAAPVDRDDENAVHEYEDVTGSIELKNDPKKGKKNKKKKPRKDIPSGGSNTGSPSQAKDGNSKPLHVTNTDKGGAHPKATQNINNGSNQNAINAEDKSSKAANDAQNQEQASKPNKKRKFFKKKSGGGKPQGEK